MTEIARKFGRLGGKTAAMNMTPEERLARQSLPNFPLVSSRGG
jgi:hypothetical protein